MTVLRYSARSQNRIDALNRCIVSARREHDELLSQSLGEENRRRCVIAWFSSHASQYPRIKALFLRAVAALYARLSYFKRRRERDMLQVDNGDNDNQASDQFKA
jgi:flagellar biosynthesis/type III secretory pathway ATPase